MSEFVTNALLKRLGLLYGPPSTDANQAKAIIAEYARLMGQYSEGELLAAADRVVTKRKFKSWPTIGDCIEVLEDHRAEVHEQNAPERKAEPTHPEWSDAAFAAADKLIDCEMGRKAAREGWILSLHDFCRRERKLPSHYQTGALIESARFVDHCAAGAIDMGLCHASLRKFADEFLVKRERLAKRVLGEAA